MRLPALCVHSHSRVLSGSTPPASDQRQACPSCVPAANKSSGVMSKTALLPPSANAWNPICPADAIPAQTVTASTPRSTGRTFDLLKPMWLMSPQARPSTGRRTKITYHNA
jgi:hypothetical protein